jgi:hypothetical protein
MKYFCFSLRWLSLLSLWIAVIALPFTSMGTVQKVGAATTQTFTTSGTWTAPADVTSVIVEAWGGGGAGGGRGNSTGSSGGGGGGAFASATIQVTPGNSYAYTVGAAVAGGKVDGATGNLSQWGTGTEIRAAGGSGGLATTTGGLGGAVGDSVGTTRFKGGDGANGGTTSGGGGGGGGTTGAGGNAVAGTEGTGTATGGGAGGAGVTNANGNPGTTAGGGGSGARRTNGNRDGGDGASGQIRITYAVVTITVSDGSVAYGGRPQATITDTTTSGVNDTQTVTNAGDSAEDINILGQNSANWTLANTAGNEQYVHSYCTTGSGSPDPCDSGATWTPLTTSYQQLATNLAVAATQRFDLQLSTPSSSATSAQQTLNITLQAVTH